MTKPPMFILIKRVIKPIKIDNSVKKEYAFAMNLTGRQTQKCPRCGCKALLNQYKCPECGLVFSKLDMATNKAAAERYKKHERNKIIMIRKTPPDLKRWKLILYTVLFGLFGGQYFYTRRWWWGIFYLLGFALLFSLVYFNGYLMSTEWGETLVNVGAVFVGAYGICWMLDIVRVCTYKFKIPVSLPSENKVVVAKEEEK